MDLKQLISKMTELDQPTNEAYGRRSSLQSEFGDFISDLKAKLQKAENEKRARADRYYAQQQTSRMPEKPVDINELKLKLQNLKNEFDPDYEYSDDPAVYAKQKRIKSEIMSLRDKIRQAIENKDQVKEQGMAENSSQPLSVQQLAAISDEALDKAYGYGRSSPGNTFGWQANLMSAAYAKKMIDAGITDIEKISDAIHKGWNVTAQKFVQNPDQFDDTEKLRQAGKLEAKLQQRAKLMKINYAQLDNEEQEKDRVVARALLQAIKGKQGVAEGYSEYDELRDRIERILIKAYNRYGTRDEVIDAAKPAAMKAAQELGAEKYFKEVWMNALASHDVDTDFGDNDDGFDITAHSMRKGELGMAEGSNPSKFLYAFGEPGEGEYLVTFAQGKTNSGTYVDNMDKAVALAKKKNQESIQQDSSHNRRHHFAVADTDEGTIVLQGQISSFPSKRFTSVEAAQKFVDEFNDSLGKDYMLSIHKVKQGMAEGCGDMEFGASTPPPKQMDNVNMNVSLNASGSGGIKDLLDIIRNIDSKEKDMIGVDDMPQAISKMGMTLDDDFANEPDETYAGIDAMTQTGGDLHSKGDEAPNQAGGGNPWNIKPRLESLYNEIKLREGSGSKAKVQAAKDKSASDKAAKPGKKLLAKIKSK